MKHMLANRVRKMMFSEEDQGTPRPPSQLPDLALRRELEVGRAYDEYCDRIDSGESIDVDEFCRRCDFPTALMQRIELHQFLIDNPSTLEFFEPIEWPEVGDTFGECRLMEELGRGASGRVFLAQESSLRRQVVLKITAGESEEAERLCQLRHPNIVPIYYFRQEKSSGLNAICMPFEGPFTLADFIDAAFKPAKRSFDSVLDVLFSDVDLDIPESTDEASPKLGFTDGVLRLGRQLASALRHSHRTGLFHLDLKPTNVLIKSDGTPLLIDFNVAINVGELPELIGGTKPYMSPEQIRCVLDASDEAPCLDGKSDVYSLGLVLLQTLSGRHPLGSVCWKGSEAEILSAQERWTPESAEDLRDVDRDVVRLLARCISPDAEQRIRMDDFIDGLDELLTRRTNHSAVSRRAILASCCAVSGVFFTGLWMNRAQPDHLYRKGVKLLEDGDHVEAATVLTRVIDHDPSHASALSHRALARLANQDDPNRFAAALDDYRRVGRISTDPVVYASMGYCEAQQGNLPNAIHYLEQAIENGADNANVHLILGVCWMRRSQHAMADEAFQASLDREPSQLGFYYRGRNSLARSMQNAPVNLEDISYIEAAMNGPLVAPAIYFTAASLWAAAPESALGSRKAEKHRKVLDYVETAIELGESPSKFFGPMYQSFEKDVEFKELMQRTPSQGPLVTPDLPHPFGKPCLNGFGAAD